MPTPHGLNVIDSGDSSWRWYCLWLLPQRFTCFSIAIAIEIAVPLAQQAPGHGRRSRSLYSGSGGGRGWCHRESPCAAASPEIPGPGDPSRHLPGPVTVPPAGWRGTRRPDISGHRAAAQVLPLGKGLAVLHQHQVDVEVADHLGHGAGAAAGGAGLGTDKATSR